MADAKFLAGSHSLKWNGKDSHGNDVSSGVYLYKIQAGDFTQTRKMLLIR
jgi:flagellar hook assembly protein FlgD